MAMAETTAIAPPIISQRQAIRTPAVAIAKAQSNGIPWGLLQESLGQITAPKKTRKSTNGALARSPNNRAIHRATTVDKSLIS
jgi:hypothetical protein